MLKSAFFAMAHFNAAIALLAVCLPALGAATCSNATASLTPDYQYFVGSSAFIGASGEAETGSAFRWLRNGSPLLAGLAEEGLLLHLDGAATGANGEAPATTQNVAFTPGKWGSSLVLGTPGRLYFGVTNNLRWDHGVIELWVALRTSPTNPVYTARDHVFFHYRAGNGDEMRIAQSGGSGIIYAGGTVNGQWESAYGGLGSMRAWKLNEWHHLAFTYSAAGNFMRFYVDGALAAENNEGHYRAPAAGGTQLAVGGDLYGTAAFYLVDEVRISGRVPDQAELAARARRTDPSGPNEVWLAVTNASPLDQLVFEFTPATANATGSVCQSGSLLYRGVPIAQALPPSTLLPMGTSNLSLTVQTLEPTRCAYSVGAALPFEQMTTFDSGSGSQTHVATIGGLNPDPNVLNDVYVRCEADPAYLHHLQYRVVGACNPPYPRTGNLWGWWEWYHHGLPYMSKVDLWLGASPRPDEIRELRRLNPHIRVLTSINAVENGGLPSDYYLKDTHGNRIEVWPGSYRLNLTKPYVADYQARFAYQTVLDTGLMADGVFFDNVMTSQSWQKTDIYGNPFPVDANEDGLVDDPAVFDAAWKAGVFSEIRTFRQLMPGAITSGHSTDVYEPGIPELFNGISIGFSTSDVLEGRMAFAALFDRYNAWLSRAVAPQVTMIESSPMAQISYGYDYDPLQKIPASTLEFARTYYPYVRFGLALTLLNDGFFAHEYGDTYHGNHWWYDELDFDLGYPLGPATRVVVPGAPATNGIVNHSFESAIAEPWRLGVSSGCAATLVRQTTNSAAGSACACITTSQTTGTDWHVGLAQWNRALTRGVTYDFSFWARSSAPRFVSLSAQKGSPDWRGYGLWARLHITTNWEPYSVSFLATETVNDARLQFFVGETNGIVWLDDVRLVQHPPDLFRRDFTRGMALLNASAEPRVVDVGPGFHRLSGTQAPMYETILDDKAPAFSLSGSWTNLAVDSGLWKASGPFYHSWAGSLRQSAAPGGEARWLLPVEADDIYAISAWWPAAPQAGSWTSNAVYEVWSGGVLAAATNLNQAANGDQWHLVANLPLYATNSTHVRLSAASGTCVADALHLRSQARFNNGQAAATVRLQPMDGIVLRRDVPTAARPGFSQAALAQDRLLLSTTNLSSGLSHTLLASTNLTGAWRIVQVFQPAGTATNLQVSLLPPECFYRLEVTPGP